MPRRIAIWNGTVGVWETTENLLCGHSALFSETWPAWGMTRSGVAFELETQQSAPLTDDSGCSLLPTPLTSDITDGTIEPSGGFRQLRDVGRPGRLLPTPTVSDPDMADPEAVARRVAGDFQPGLSAVLLHHMAPAEEEEEEE